MEVFLILKLKNTFQPFGIVLAGIVVITLLTTLGGLWHYNSELKNQPTIEAAKAKTELGKATQKEAISNQDISSSSGDSSTSNTKTPSAKTSTEVSKSSTKQVNSVARVNSINVSLSVNGVPKGTVSLATGSNQCDLLSKAYSSGNISSLDMRYSSQYKTFGVYVIDGIGDPGTVWWTYKVNGSEPPFGCANMPAKDGDSVNWQYVKK